MVDLSVSYMGLSLRNPLIVSASSLTNSVDKIKRCEDAGAGAVVLKSLFEEQIESSTQILLDESSPYSHPEAFDYVHQMSVRMGQDQYLDLIAKGKASVDIPVIASLNCVSPKWWTSFAKQIAKEGADAIELNLSLLPSSFSVSADDVEKTYVSIVESICGKIEIPVAAKIGPYFTSLPQTARTLRRAGLSALVLFNRFYQMDIDIDKFELAPGYHLSSPDEIHLPLRWIAILANQVGCDLAASTGVHDGAGVIKQLLAGANAVQVCSNLYLKGLTRIGVMLKELENWMAKNEFISVEDFRGRLCQEASERPEYYERLQYIKLFVGIE